jgi:hypothetical protein
MARIGWMAGSLWALAGLAAAGNLEKFAFGEDAAMVAGAVLADTQGNGSLWYNPAGLAVMSADSVDLDVSAYAARTYDIARFVQVQLPDQQAALDFHGSSFFSTPAAVVWGRRLQPGLGLAAAFYTRDQLDIQSQSSATYLGNFSPGNPYSDSQGVDLGLRSNDYLGGLGLGWQPRGWLRVGLSALGEYQHDADELQFWNDEIALNSYDPGTGLYGSRTTTHTDEIVGIETWGVRGVAGLQADLGGGLSLGLAFRSPRFDLYQDQQADLQLEGDVVAPGAGAIIRFHGDADSVSHPYVWDGFYQAQAGLAYKAGAWTWDAEANASDLPAEQGNGTVFNGKAGVLWALDDRWTLGGGAYTDLQHHTALNNFLANNVDYYGGNVGLRRRQLLGHSADGAPVTLSSTLSLHYERGTGQFAGAQVTAGSLALPLPVVVTDATFQDYDLHLASSLDW